MLLKALKTYSLSPLTIKDEVTIFLFKLQQFGYFILEISVLNHTHTVLMEQIIQRFWVLKVPCGVF